MSLGIKFFIFQNVHVLDSHFWDFPKILLNEPYMAQEAPGLVFVAINVQTKIPKSGLGLIWGPTSGTQMFRPQTPTAKKNFRLN